MQRAYLVFGPESSGTRYMTRLLLAAGCQGSSEHEQPFDVTLPPCGNEPIVWRRSFPHAAKWTNIPLMIHRVKQQGYLPHVIVMQRDMYSVIQSQLAATHVTSVKQAIDNMKRAYNIIWSVDYELYTTVVYENLIKRPEKVVSVLMDRPIYQFDDIISIDANEKWYQDGRFNF